MVIQQMKKQYTWWFTLTMSILFVQYVRPYDITGLTFLAVVRPYFVLAAILTLVIIFNKGQQFFQLGFSQIRLIWLILLWMIIQIPFSSVKAISFLQTRDMFMLIPYILSLVIVVNNVTRLKQFANILIGIGVILSLRGIYLHDGFFRGAMFNLGNFLSDPNDFSLFMDMMLPFSFFLMMYENKWNKKILYGIAAALCMVCSVISFSRGGFVGMLFVGAVIWWYSPNKLLTTSAITVAAVLVVLFAGKGYIDQMGRATDINDPTAQTRIIMWKGSWEAFKANPILGIGPGETRAVVYKYTTDGNPSRWYGDVSHSVWITTLTEGGLVGMCLFLWLVFNNIKDTRRIAMLEGNDDDTRFLKYFSRACLASIFAYLSAGTFLTVNYYPHFWYLTAIIAATTKIVYDTTYQRRFNFITIK